MPRRKLARRFEPRGGVSQLVIDAEAVHVGREVEDYLLYSLTDLKGKLDERRRLLDQVQQELEALLKRLPEREYLAMQCILYRDFHHIGALYRTYLTAGNRPALGEEEASIKAADPVPLPFREWLFPTESE
jgi:tetrahydromethanopterin S-methyltransferase subunit B